MNRRLFLKNLSQTGLSSAVAGSSGMLLSADEEQTRDLALLLHVLEPSRPPQTGRINATDRTWEEWQRRTGELPPRFSQMPAQPFLPDPLAGVKTKLDWEKRREAIRKDVEHWLTGRMPPAPENLRAVMTREERQNGILVRDVRLEFGPGHRGTLRLQLLIPPRRRPAPGFSHESQPQAPLGGDGGGARLHRRYLLRR